VLRVRAELGEGNEKKEKKGNINYIRRQENKGELWGKEKG